MVGFENVMKDLCERWKFTAREIRLLKEQLADENGQKFQDVADNLLMNVEGRARPGLKAILSLMRGTHETAHKDTRCWWDLGERYCKAVRLLEAGRLQGVLSPNGEEFFAICQRCKGRTDIPLEDAYCLEVKQTQDGPSRMISPGEFARWEIVEATQVRERA